MVNQRSCQGSVASCQESAFFAIVILSGVSPHSGRTESKDLLFLPTTGTVGARPFVHHRRMGGTNRLHLCHPERRQRVVCAAEVEGPLCRDQSWCAPNAPPSPQAIRRSPPRQRPLFLHPHASSSTRRATPTLSPRLGPARPRLDMPRPLRPPRIRNSPQTLAHAISIH